MQTIKTTGADSLTRRYTVESRTPGGYWLILESFDTLEGARLGRAWHGLQCANGRIFDQVARTAL